MANRSDTEIEAAVEVAKTTRGRHMDMLIELNLILIELQMDCRKYLKEIKQAVEAE